MADKQSGSRPVPKVPVPGNTFRKPSGDYGGKRSTADPSGSRPIPQVAANSPTFPTPGNMTKPAIKHTPMPRPNKAAQRSSKGRQYGSGQNVK